jgi:uncharacterized protein
MRRVFLSAAFTGLMALMIAGVPHLVFGAHRAIHWHTDVASALQDAKTTNRPIMMFVTAKWCKFCHKMENVTFANAAISQKVDDNFVALLIDADEQPELIERFKIEGFPSTLFFGPDGKLRSRTDGYLSPPQASRWFDTVCMASK